MCPRRGTPTPGRKLADRTHGGTIVPVVVVPVATGELLARRVVVVVLGGPVETSGIRTASVSMAVS